MKAIHSYTIALAAIMTLAFFGSYTNDSIPGNLQPEFPNNNYGPQYMRAVKMPSYIEFAGERVPIENFDVKERLDREIHRNTFFHSSMFHYIKLSNRYFPIIEPILAEYGVPNDFKYLAVAESGLRNAVSSAGARGVWQFMKGSARHFKLVIDNEVDERYNIEKATRAACKHLLGDKRRFGSWAMAAASYNMGSPRLSKQMGSQQVQDYYDLHLNDETSRYLFRIIAIREVMKDPEKYGYIFDYDDLYPQFNSYQTVTVSGSISSLASFAKKHGTTYRKLKLYNPWLRQPYLKNRTRRTYQIKVPYS